ncbi:MAG: hypothetical protein HOO04_03530 [Phycisphaerae bacterium]|jgi:hypothetical protein|nr:hypothetical protein [Phycisphaerae bacterium]
MSQEDTANAVLSAFEACYEELYLSVRPHVTAPQAEAICRGAFKYLIRKYLEKGETIIPSPDCLLHTARAFAQVQVDRLRKNTNTSNHEASTLSN